MLNSGNNPAEKRLYRAAQVYAASGYSVIPVYGDVRPTHAKVASVSWSRYQRSHATASELACWFHQEQHGGIAIVTGSISRLVVLDFDDPNLAEAFATRFPELTDTKVIHSAGRQLPHYYYELPRGYTLQSRRLAGLDVLSDGRYVIAPPTTIDGQAYRVIQGGMPGLLTPDHIYHLEQFFESLQVYTPEPSVETQSEAITGDSETVSEPTSVSDNSVPVGTVSTMPVVSAEDLLMLYQHFAPAIGRNQALFQIALRARDAGWSQADTTMLLSQVHADQPASTQHRAETEDQRLTEAFRTIGSAFSRPPRKPASDSEPVNLPNSVREAFLQRKQTAVVRVLDGLFMKNVQPGALLTEREICELLQDTVGRHSVLVALKACFAPDNRRIFQRINPSPGTPPRTAVADVCRQSENNKCLLFTLTESNKKKRGRPPAKYLVPDVKTLCDGLDVPYMPGDRLKWEDLTGAKTYREALHRELIKRRPGLYSRKWLAKRLGISERTSRRYGADGEIQSRAMYRQIWITWDNLHDIPEGLPDEGTFLQDHTGRRYPPKRTIARTLLRKRRQVRYMRQEVNYYWHRDQPAAASGPPENSLKMPENTPYSFGKRQLIPVIRESVKTPENGVQPVTDPATLKNTDNPLTDHTVPTGTLSQPAPAVNIPAKSVKMLSDKPDKPAREPQSRKSKACLPSDYAYVLAALSPADYIPKRKRYYQRSLPDHQAEQAARYLYGAIRDRCEDHKGYLSMARARRLTEEYGPPQVRQAVTRMESRDNIRNPAGFVVTLLRSDRVGQRLQC